MKRFIEFLKGLFKKRPPDALIHIDEEVYYNNKGNEIKQ